MIAHATHHKYLLTSPARSKNLVSATITTMKLPTLTVSSHMLADNAFIDAGDCEYLQGFSESKRWREQLRRTRIRCQWVR